MKKHNPFLKPIALLLVLIAALTLIWLFYSKYEAEKKYQQIPQSVEETTETEGESKEEKTEAEPETEPPYQSPIDFESLKKINPDVVAWITVPDTNIDYPVLYRQGDNETYLHKDLEGKESVAGAVFLDGDDAPDFSDLHNILYGHHMKDGSMFRDVMKFRDQSFLESHQEIRLYLPDWELLLKPFACLYTSPDGIRRKTKFADSESFYTYVENMTEGAEAYVQLEMPSSPNQNPDQSSDQNLDQNPYQSPKQSSDQNPDQSPDQTPDQFPGRLFSLVTCSYEFNNARTILYCYTVDMPEPEKTNAQPEKTNAQPETTDAQPETTDAQPETADAQKETANTQPETTDIQPEPTGARP